MLLHIWPDLVPEVVGRITEALEGSAGFVGVDELAAEPGFEPLGFPRPGTRLRDAFAIPS